MTKTQGIGLCSVNIDLGTVANTQGIGFCSVNIDLDTVANTQGIWFCSVKGTVQPYLYLKGEIDEKNEILICDS